tara:strand:+ start:3694 stop:4338 length:645 start_codon:yes stop_codon:yes gene_type:complete
MAIRSLLTKGIGSLLKRKPKPNRRLTPEEIAERKAKEQEERVLGEYMRYKYASPVRSPGTTAMRAKKVGDETMEMIKDSVMKMDLPADKKVEAIKSAATAVRNADSAALAKANPAQLSMDIIKMIGATGAGFVGGAMMEGAAREGRLPEMIQDSFLVKPEFRGMRDTGDAVGKMMGATMMGASAGGGYDEPDPEPGLEEGSIADLLLFNRLFGD